MNGERDSRWTALRRTEIKLRFGAVIVVQSEREAVLGKPNSPRQLQMIEKGCQPRGARQVHGPPGGLFCKNEPEKLFRISKSIEKRT